MFRGWRRPEKGFFDEFEKQLEEMNKIMNSMMQDLGKEAQVYGFSMLVGPDGVPHVEHFGKVIPSVKENRENNVREPFTSSMINDKDNELYITAEMPGIRRDDIEVSATENEVVIRAESVERKYYKSVKIPSVDPDSARAKYNNGVLEVTLKLKESQEPKGKSVKIE